MSKTQESPRRRPLGRFLADAPTALQGVPAVARPAHVGEVIESSTTELIAEACQLHGAPSFGRFVRVESESPVIAMVFNVFTHSIEPNRRPTAYGKTEAELRLEQPQIFELLRTEFQALVVGYRDETGPVPILPPQPARIHSFVYLCEDEEVAEFTRSDEYLRSILGAAKVPTDELLVATLRHALRARGGEGAYLVEMGKELSRLLRDDYDRLSSILRRIAR